MCAARRDPTPTGPPGSRFYPSWPQLQFCPYTQIHLGPLRAALLVYGQKCLAASFRLISFSDLSRLIIAASPILTTETTRSSSFMCFPVVLCHHYGCDHGFHYHFLPCLLFSSNLLAQHNSPSYSLSWRLSIIVSPRSRRFVWSMTLMRYFLCHCNTSHKFRSSMCCCRARNQCFIL